MWILPISMALMLLVPLMYLRASCRSKNPVALPINWPILHMFPSFVANLHNMPAYFTLVLTGSGHNFRAHGPPGSGMRFFVTCDPANIQHIFTTNYPNFPKGAGFAAIFDIMGGSLFTIDGEPAHRMRAKVKGVLNGPQLVDNLACYCITKVKNSLLPLFAHMVSIDTPFDMQEMMSRFMFDLSATSLFGVDPGLLSSDLPPMDVAVALDTVMEVGFSRHVMPTSCWKLMRWLNIGPERKLSTAHTVLRSFVVEMMERWKNNTCHTGNDDSGADIMPPFLGDPDYAGDELVLAMIISYLLAARDTITATLTWVFYNLAQNPNIVSIIRNELSPIASGKAASSASAMVIFEPEETKTLVHQVL